MIDLNGEPLVILLVEDNEDHATLVMRSMQDQRVANVIYHMDYGQKAPDYLFHTHDYEKDGSSPVPNVILPNLRLPKVDGLEVLKIIKQTQNLQRIPVVILTSSDAESDVARSYDYHANSYVVKPLDFNNFTKLMADLGFYWPFWNARPHLPF